MGPGVAVPAGRVSAGRQIARVGAAALVLGGSWLAGAYLIVLLVFSAHFCGPQSLPPRPACQPGVTPMGLIVMPIVCLATLGLCSGAVFCSSQTSHRTRRLLAWAAGLMAVASVLAVALLSQGQG